jgi:hypothetical protein
VKEEKYDIAASDYRFSMTAHFSRQFSMFPKYIYGEKGGSRTTSPPEVASRWAKYLKSIRRFRSTNIHEEYS